jgi:hypothetical protein
LTPNTSPKEFKEAKLQFDTRKLSEYCVAIANEGGGHIAERPEQQLQEVRALCALLGLSYFGRWPMLCLCHL